MEGSDSTVDQVGYEAFCDFLKHACGIVLGENKAYLVFSRLNKLMDEHDINSLSELVMRLKQYPESRLYALVVDAMTTNETSWFRDQYPYDFLMDQLIPEVIAKGRSLRIWSAAASSGQEPYSISIIIQEYLNSSAIAFNQAEIIATDISHAAIRDAREGIFDQMTLDRGMSSRRLNHFFEPHEKMWRLKDEIRERVNFREFNLLGNYASLGKFDIVFCRNVLIYFSADTKKDILMRIAGTLNPGGYLFLGGAESMATYSEMFEVIRLGNGLAYRLKE